MDEGFLIALGVLWLASPVALAVAVALQARKRRDLEDEVRRLARQVDALGRRVAATGAPAGAQAAAQAASQPAPQPTPAPAPPVEAGPPAWTTWPAPADAAPSVAAAEPAATAWPGGEGPVLDTTLPPPLPAPPPLPPPAAAAPPPPPAAAPPPAPRPAFDWEQLVGVRLFSWVAGVALIVAGISFLLWSIEHGWLGPPVRAAIGTALGLGLVLGAETGRARRYAVTAHALAGAGVAILFATTFAAHALWSLLPPTATFALMVLVTAVAVAYAVRREALAVAVLGLLGGFATPILLSTGQDRPVGLFSYLLVLNVGLAWVAHRRRWPLVGALALGLTAVYQLGWMLRFLGAHNLLVGMVVFLVFPAFGFLVLALASRRDAQPPPLVQWAASLGAVPPLLFLLRTVTEPALLAHWPMVLAFAVLLCAGLLVVAALQGPEWLHLAGAAGAVVAVVGVLVGLGDHGHAVEGFPASAWPGLLVPPLAVAAVLLLGPRLLAARGRPLRALGRLGAFGAPLLLGALSLVPDLMPAGAQPLLVAAAVVALAAGAALTAAAAADGPLLLATGLLAPWGGVALAAAAPGGEAGAVVPVLAGALGLGAVALGALRAAERGEPDAAREPWFVAGLAALLLAGQLTGAAAGAGAAADDALAAALHHGLQLLLLAGLLAVAARTGRHAVALVAAVAAALVAFAFGEDVHRPGAALLLAAALWALQVAVPWLQLRRGAGSRLLLWAPALASALTLVLFRAYLHDLGLAWLVGPAAVLQALALVPHLLVLLRAPGALERERSRIVVVAGAILALVTAAIPLQLENEWITIGLALLAPALAWLHARVPHRGLLAWIAGLALVVGVRLLLNGEVLHYHARSGTPVLNFWLYAYGVPALAMLAAARLLPAGDDRLRPDLPRLAPLLAALGGVLLFALLNVEIADAFSEGTWVRVRLRGSLAYDLALTIGWACFAVGLLAVGVVRHSKPVRVAAIALLAVTVLKGFLLDLSALSGLYRVGSFVGLAVSLALVAVVLQRFVLGDRARG